MTQFLPPNLLALFAARDPIPYLPPAAKLPHEKKQKGYDGVGAFLDVFEHPSETPPPTRVETREERMERRRRERAEQTAYKLEQEIALWDPSTNPKATMDPFKTLFVARINYDTSESKLRREFEGYGAIKKAFGAGYHEDIGIPEASRIRLKEAQRASERISGGVTSNYGDNPYLAGILITLRSGQMSVCSGTLVSTRKVLTAAQCWYDGYNVGRKAEITLGSLQLFSSSKWEVLGVTVHPEYNPNNLLNDLAMMTLRYSTWQGNDLMPAFLPNNTDYDFAGEEARVSGYGKTSDYDELNPNTNQQSLIVKVMGPWECYWSMARRPADSSKVMCTPGSVLWGTCGADLGGPLVVPNFNATGNHLLIGVVSIQSPFGCYSSFATGYTRVTAYKKWIEQNL